MKTFYVVKQDKEIVLKFPKIPCFSRKFPFTITIPEITLNGTNK